MRIAYVLCATLRYIMSDFIEEESEIMDEMYSADEQEHSMSKAISIEDPIKALNIVPVLTINENASLHETISFLIEKKIGCLVVNNDKDETVGIFTERDILRKMLSNNLDFKKEIIKDYMTPNPEVLDENDPIAFALNRMSDGSYRHIPITHKGKVKYMLSVKDVVDHIAFIYRKNVLNLPPNLNQNASQVGG